MFTKFKLVSYQERDLLGRSLTPNEIREVTHMARRLAAIVLMESTLTANYKAVKESCYPWQGWGPDGGSKVISKGDNLSTSPRRTWPRRRKR